jgi:hypothetical protein
MNNLKSYKNLILVMIKVTGKYVDKEVSANFDYLILD